MNNSEKQYIHTLFETGNYMKIYQVWTDIINEMLSIEDRRDFEDFIDSENLIEEDVFWLHYAAAQGESLLIGGYEEDVTEKISDFLRKRLPDNIFMKIQGHFQQLYVDIDAEDNLEEKINLCNQCLAHTDYLLQLDYDDTYCAGVYFLSVRTVPL